MAFQMIAVILVFMFIMVSICYKVIQRFRVTCFIAGQCNTDLLWHITDIIAGQCNTDSLWHITDIIAGQCNTDLLWHITDII